MVSGEIDLAAVPVMRCHLEELTANGHERVVLDLREVTFIDSSGIALLFSWARRPSRVMVAIAPGGHVEQTLALTGALDHLELLNATAPPRVA